MQRLVACLGLCIAWLHNSGATLNRDPKRAIIAAIFIFAFLLGLAEGYLHSDRTEQPLLLVGAIMWSCFALAWCWYDSIDRESYFPRWLRVCIVLVPIIGMPYYLLSSRGRRGILPIVGVLGIVLAAASVEVFAGELMRRLIG
jgi:hypothetical protein